MKLAIDASYNFRDVSSHYAVNLRSTNMYEYSVYHKKTKRIIARVIPGKYIHIDEEYYVYYAHGRSLEVLTQRDEEFDSIRPKMLVEKLYYVNAPRNSLGSLIDPLGITDYTTFFIRTRTCDQSYFHTAALAPSVELGEWIDGDEEVDNLVPRAQVSELMSVSDVVKEEIVIEDRRRLS